MKKQTTINDLAEMVQRGFTEISNKMDKRFEGVGKRFEEVGKRFERVDDEFRRVHARLDSIDNRIASLDVVPRHEFDDLFGRVSYIERKLGIVSGK